MYMSQDITKQVYAAGLIAAGEGYLDLSIVKALRKRKVRKVLLREFDKWKAERALDNLEVVALDSELQNCCDRVKGFLKRRYPFLEFDGSFLEAFLTFLIENKEEIFELIKTIISFIGMFGMLKDSRDPLFSDVEFFALAVGLADGELDVDSFDIKTFVDSFFGS